MASGPTSVMLTGTGPVPHAAQLDSPWGGGVHLPAGLTLNHTFVVI